MNKYFAASIFIISLLGFVAVSQFWNDDDSTNVSFNHFVRSDGGGYYNYLPSFFVRHDLGNDTSGQGTVFVNSRGKTINKYFVGTAILDLPFFAIGYFQCYLRHEVIDGYNYVLQRDAALASFFYFLLGCWFTLHWLQLKTGNAKIAVVALFVTILSTSIAYYFTYEPFYSHCYSFCFIAMFLYAMQSYFTSKNSKFLYYASLALATVIIIRPTNAIIIFLIPYLAGSLLELKQLVYSLLKNRIQLVLLTLIFFAIISLQPIVNYLQCGNFFEWGYKREGFIFDSPQIFKVLFSFECGIFIYLPISIVALIGVFRLRQFYQKVSILFFLVALFYVLSSWWCYTFGDSLIWRPLTDFTSVGALLVVNTIQSVKNLKAKIILYSFITFSIIYNVKIFYQFSNGILHFDRMNFEKYIYTFNKLSKSDFECLGGNKIQGIYSAKQPLEILNIKNSFAGSVNYFETKNAVADPLNTKNKCLYFDANEFNDGFCIENDTAIYNSNALYADVSLLRREVGKNSSCDALFVMHLTYPNSKKQTYLAFKFNELPQDSFNIWRKWNYTIDIPKPLFPNYKLALYVWNIQKQKFYIDDVHIKIYRLY